MSKGRLCTINEDGTQGVSFKMKTAEMSIGREKSNDVVIPLSSVSRSHAKISMDENGLFFISNLSKTNQTFLNGNLLTGHQHLSDHDVISIADHQFIYLDDITDVCKLTGKQLEGSISSLQLLEIPLLRA